ncbi:type-1 fimbrial protein subunit A (plasmid) [Serratia marcescens]|nr:type-1 fimbrial protein subunit A [Serratia marcescens]
MKLNAIAVVMGAAMVLCAGTASASSLASGSGVTVNGGTVHFKGKLVAAPCSVSTKSSDQTVNLGEYTTHHFNAKGTVGTIQPFEIKLLDCDTSTASTAAAAFSGITDSDDTTLLAVNQEDATNGSVTATGVGIKIMDDKNAVVPLDGATFVDSTIILDGDATPALKFTAQYVGTTGKATGGDANSHADFIMQYN